MMKPITIYLFAILAVLPAQAGDAPARGPEPTGRDYLTADGKLKERIEVSYFQGGVAGVTGDYYAVEPDGTWSSGGFRSTGRMEKSETAKGKLAKDQLVKLAKEFARFDLAHLPHLPDQQANPGGVGISFGKKESDLGNRAAGKDPAVNVRYQGIAEAVKGALTQTADIMKAL